MVLAIAGEPWLRRSLSYVGQVTAAVMVSIRSGLYQAGVKPWTLWPWAQARATRLSRLGERHDTSQRTGSTSAHCS